MKITDRDKEIADKALAESEAQTSVIKALAPLNSEKRGNVLSALRHIMAAEQFVPGIMGKLAGEKKA